MDERVKRAVLFMEGNWQLKLRLRQIANSVGLSPSRLSTLFLKDLEVSPMRHLKTLRMQEARALLRSSTLNVKEIAAHAGFNDISHFIFAILAVCTVKHQRRSEIANPFQNRKIGQLFPIVFRANMALHYLHN